MAAGNITAAGQIVPTVPVRVPGKNLILISGTFTGTLQAELSTDGTNWSPTGDVQSAPGSLSVDVPWNKNVKLRVRSPSWTSGTARVEIL